MSAAPSLPPNQLERERPPKAARHRIWAKVIGWTAAGLLAILVLAAITLIVLLRSQRVHNYVLRTAQQQASAALNTPVQLRDYTLRFSGISPAVDLYDVVVQGTAPYSNTPLLQAGHIRVSVRVTSVLRRTWYLNEVTIDRPVARVFVDRNGMNNLPKLQGGGQGGTNVFDLGIRHAAINGGEIFYNDHKSSLQADLHDVKFRSVFKADPQEYAGRLSYRDGRLRSGAYNPIAHNLDAQFAATPTRFTLKQGVLSSGRTRIALSGTARDYSQPRVQAKYDAVVDAGEFRRIMKNASVPTGLIRAAGEVRYENQPNRPMLETVTVSGNLSSGALQVRTPQYRGEIRDLSTRYTLANGKVEIPNLRARLLGGELTANMTMRNVTGNSQSKLQAALRGASLAELKPLANSSALRRVALHGTVNADANAAWGKTFDDLTAQATATVQASMASAGKPASSVPLSASINARYAANKRQLTLFQSYARLPQTALSLNGTVSERSSLQINLHSRDLHELETVAGLFRTSAQPPGLYGTASFVGAVTGSTNAPRITGQLTASDIRAKGSAWRLVRAKVEVGPSRASLRDGVAQAEGRGRITFNLSAGLRRYTFTQTSPVEIAVNAAEINIADLLKTAGVQTPASGTLSANVTMRGSQLNPVGQGRINLTRAQIANQPIQTASLNFNGTGDQVQGNLMMRLPAGSAQGTFTVFPKQQSYQAQLSSDGIQLAQLQAVKAGNVRLSGMLKLDASGRGTFTNPELQATIQVPQLQIQDQAVNGLTLRAAVANRVADLALDSKVVNTSLRGRGRIHLTGDYQAEATLDTETIPLQPLVAMYAPAQGANIGGQTEAHATLRGPLKDRSRLEAHIVLPTLQMNYRNTVQVGAANPVKVDYLNGLLTLQRTSIRGTGTDLELQGTVPMMGDAPVSLLLLGTVDLRLAQLLNPDVTSSGQLRFNINSLGRRSNPNVQGEVHIVNANFSSGSMPVGLQNGNGILTLTKDRLNITQFRGMVGGGTVTARGGVVYRPALRFELAMAGQDLRVLYPRGVREVVDLDLTLTGGTEAALLRGLVRVDQLSFTPDFDLASFLGQFSGGIASPPAQGFTQNLQLNIGVQSTSGLNLVSRTLSVQGAANLRVQGTAADPVVLGRVNLNGGDVIFNDHRFVLQGGTVDFINPTRTEPVLNVGANTTIDQYNIQLRLSGPMDHLRTNYTSDPGLPQSDIISLLAFGKTTEASAANPTPGNLAAQSAIASQVSEQVTSRLERIAGISQLSVDPLLGCNQQAKGGCITIRQRVTGQIFVTFQTDVTSAQRDTIQLEYQYTPRVSFSGTRDQNGGFGFDTRIRKTW